MDFNQQGLIYVLMVIPIGLAIAVLAQGIQKISHNQPEGNVITGFGIFFVILIIAAYFLFIR